MINTHREWLVLLPYFKLIITMFCSLHLLKNISICNLEEPIMSQPSVGGVPLIWLSMQTLAYSSTGGTTSENADFPHTNTAFCDLYRYDALEITILRQMLLCQAWFELCRKLCRIETLSRYSLITNGLYPKGTMILCRWCDNNTASCRAFGLVVSGVDVTIARPPKGNPDYCQNYIHKVPVPVPQVSMVRGYVIKSVSPREIAILIVLNSYAKTIGHWELPW